jgi:hypothetical protein
MMAEDQTDDRRPATDEAASAGAGSRATSKKVAKEASKIMNDPNATQAEKSVAASALAQVDKNEGGKRSAVDVQGEAEKPKRLLKFRASEKSPTLDVMVGEYRRSFNAADQPFEVADEEEEQLLRGTGHFVLDREAEKAGETES